MPTEEMPTPHSGVSVIVPTRNEAGNVRSLLERIVDLPEGLVHEVVFVDDSDDDTPEVIAAASHRCPFSVRVLHRESAERAGGLSGAVLKGFRAARGEFLCVMDGDLQHPPELIAELERTARTSSCDLVCATRYAKDGDAQGLHLLRAMVSRSSTIAARTLFPRRLAGVSDPMSGFFLVRREALDLKRMRPLGFKILLEILVRHRGLRCTEVPYHFDERAWGDTKASVRQGLLYLAHLLRLRSGGLVSESRGLRPTLRFAAVGAVGIVVNEVVLVLLVSGAGVGYALAAILATQPAIVSNFALVQRWVFPDGRAISLRRRFTAFWLASNLVFALGLPLLALLVSGIGMHYAAANLVVIGAQFLARLVVSDRVIWPVAAMPTVEPVVLAAAEATDPALDKVVSLADARSGVRVS